MPNINAYDLWNIHYTIQVLIIQQGIKIKRKKCESCLKCLYTLDTNTHIS